MKNSFKKIIAIVMTLVLAMGILAICPVAATADIAVKTDRASYLNNETVTATVYFPAAYNKVASFDMVLNYDSTKLSVVSVEDGAGLTNAIKAQQNGRVYSEGHDKAGEIKWSLAGTNNFSFSGTFATVVFTVKAKASNGNTDLSLNVKRAVNSGLVAMTINTQSTKIEIIKLASSDLEYELSADKKGYEIIGYHGASESVLEIPETFAGLPIVGIAKSVFGSHGELQTVKLPSTLKYIGEGAFNGCSALKEIVIPDSVETIGANAFNGCGITSVTLPIGLKTIEKNTFYYCPFLTKVEIPFTVTKICDGAFENCYSLSEVKISRNTKDIAADAFKSAFLSLVFKTAEDNTYLPTYVSANFPNAKIEKYTDFSLGTAKVSQANVQYTGKQLKPSVTVSLKSGASVTINKNYKVVYKNNIEKGTATVYVAGLGEYGEGYVLTFKIICNHNFASKTVGLKETCTTDGYYNCTCGICGEIVKETIPASGHKEGSWVIDKRPTITGTGLKHTACTKCGALMQTGVSMPKAFPDLNGDKYINSMDALIILQYATEIQNNLKTEKQLLDADTNGDGNINSSDALTVLQIAIGKTKIEGYTA